MLPVSGLHSINDAVINEYETVGGMRNDEGTKSTTNPTRLVLG
jgi:hypothetical protein